MSSIMDTVIGTELHIENTGGRLCEIEASNGLMIDVYDVSRRLDPLLVDYYAHLVTLLPDMVQSITSGDTRTVEDMIRYTTKKIELDMSKRGSVDCDGRVKA